MNGAVWLASYAVLWGAVVVLLVMVLALVRQIGVLHLRLDDVTAAAAAAVGVSGSSAASSDEGPEVGVAAPLPGKLGYERAPMTVVAFVAEGCELSELLLPALRRVDKQYGDTVRVVQLDLGSRTMTAFEEFRVAATPFVVCVDRDGVVRARGRARSLPQLEDLVASAGAAALAAATSARAAGTGGSSGRAPDGRGGPAADRATPTASGPGPAAAAGRAPTRASGPAAPAAGTAPAAAPGPARAAAPGPAPASGTAHAAGRAPTPSAGRAPAPPTPAAGPRGSANVPAPVRPVHAAPPPEDAPASEQAESERAESDAPASDAPASEQAESERAESDAPASDAPASERDRAGAHV